METYPKDVLYRLAIEMDLPTLLKFCSSSKKINDKVCKQNDIWYYKLNTEFPDWRNWGLTNKLPRDIYTLMYKLTTLKQKLNRNENIYDLYE